MEKSNVNEMEDDASVVGSGIKLGMLRRKLTLSSTIFIGFEVQGLGFRVGDLGVLGFRVGDLGV